MPEKWVEYRWICEGIENRPNAASKRKEKLKAEALENESTVLSPQRRGFSSGCRAASPTKKGFFLEIFLFLLLIQLFNLKISNK